MDDDTIFRLYLVKRKEDDGILATFSKKSEAIKTIEYVNNIFKQELYVLEIKNIKKDNYIFSQSEISKWFSSFESFHDEIESRIKINKQLEKDYKDLDPNKLTFVKYENYWYELDTSTPLKCATVYNSVGGKMLELDLTNSPLVQANSFNELDWSDTRVFSDRYKTGWLSPDGKFYGCSYEAHLFQAKYLHNKSEREMEESGWIKIARDYDNPTKVRALLCYDESRNLIRPTYAQMDYLKNSEITNYEEISYMLKYSFAGIGLEGNLIK